MFKKIAILFFFSLFVAGVSHLIAADTPASTSTPKNEYKVTGTIDKIDTVNKKIFVKFEGKDEKKEFSYDNSTSFWSKDDKSQKVDDLKVGDHVMVHTSGSTSTLATKVEIES
jgi:hypothetical protein